MLPEHKQKNFKQDYGAFFGVEDRDTAKLDYNKLYQASREAPKGSGATGIPKEMKNNSMFAKDSKVFFGGEASETNSNYGRAAQAFYGNNGVQAGADASKTLGGKFESIQDRIVPANMKSELYKRNTGNFAGEEVELLSNGSVFKNNLNKFHGLDTETAKFKIEDKPVQAKKVTVNEKSGLYKKDAANFHGADKFEIESQGT